MISVSVARDLDSTRRRIVQKLRDIRRARGWSQAELAARLGLSQARLSVIERGGGSISAEQFVALLALTNLPIEAFLPRQDPDDEVQNALARLGALHLRELDDVVPTERFRRVEDALVETLAAPRSSRFVLALAPVVVWNVDHVSLDQASERLARIGLAARMGWFVETLALALPLARLDRGSAWWKRWRRAELVLVEFTARPEGLRPPSVVPEAPLDHLDAQLKSVKSLHIEWSNTDRVARRWGIATELGAVDFARTIMDAASNA